MTSGAGLESRTLAERLGYGRDARLLIVNCDDLGSSHGANVATLQAMAQGVATSATLMVPCPWAPEAARMLQGFPVGVHLTLTSEYHDYRWRGLTPGSSLHDEDGFLPSRAKAAIDRLDPSDANEECQAQIETAMSWGVDVTHIDMHMDVLQARVDLFEVYLDLAERFRLPLRMLSDEAIGERHYRPRERAQERGLLSNERIIYPWPRKTKDVFFEEVPRLSPGVTEIFAHPVVDGEELRVYDRDNAHIRAHDALCLTDPAVQDLLDRHDVKRISYREIRNLQRAHK